MVSPSSPELDLRELREDLARRGVRTLAIDGRGGSGKSTLARHLADGWPEAVVVEMDDFYRPSADRKPRPSSHGANYDLHRLVTEVMAPLAAGHSGRYQRYDWDGDRLAEWHELPTDTVVLVEGVYSTSAPLRQYFDTKIWVACPYDVRLARGIARDGEEMRAKWTDEWMPAEDAYVKAEAPDEHADLVVEGGGGTSATTFRLVVDRRPGAQIDSEHPV